MPSIRFPAIALLLATCIHAAPDKSLIPRLLWPEAPIVIKPEATASPQRYLQLWAQNVYPIGNGRLGATIFGEPKNKHIQFNEDSLWVGNEDNTGAYQPFGDFLIELPHAEFSNCRRECFSSHPARSAGRSVSRMITNSL